MDAWAGLEAEDHEIWQVIQDEEHRAHANLELIASESYPSRAVLEATGSVLTAKYAEGYPGRRYYGGCEVVDRAENLARDRARELFGAEHVNVQPHAGAQANMAVFHALLERGDTVLGLALDQGGHLTHGSPVNFSGQYYNFVPYHVDRETHLIDMEEVRALAREHRPKMIVTGATAYPRHWDFAAFREIADEVGALLMTDMSHFAGLVAGGVHPSPVPHADVVTTTTHKTLRGPRGAMILCREAHAKDIDRAVFPAIQGGPLMHVIAAKAVAFHQAMSPEFRADAQHTVDNARALGEALAQRGSFARVRRDRHPLAAGGRDPVRRDGQGGRSSPGRGGHHGQQERHPLRPQPANGGERGSGGDAVRHRAGDGDRRDGPDRGAARGWDSGPRGSRRAGRRPGAGGGPGRALPGARIGVDTRLTDQGRAPEPDAILAAASDRPESSAMPNTSPGPARILGEVTLIMVIPMLGGVVIGLVLDAQAGTSPIFVLGGLALGSLTSAAGIWLYIRKRQRS